ncbi:hypothetical protein N2152v2_001778 [Parachlorella kessleri]
MSGAQGYISEGTLRLFAALRQLGAKLVLISGARASTLLQRLPQLPAADAYVCESGGRIFLTDSHLPTAVPLREDLDWRQQHCDVTGPLHQDAVAPAKRAGKLWELYAELEGEGWKPDATSYTTAFRVKRRSGQTDADLAALQQRAPPGVTSAGNLGALDFFPATTGKENAAEYVMQHFGVAPGDSVLMCDDDNDLGLAACVRKAYLPGITAPSVQAAVDAAPERFYVSQHQGWRGTEEVLKVLVQERLAEL